MPFVLLENVIDKEEKKKLRTYLLGLKKKISVKKFSRSLRQLSERDWNNVTESVIT